MDHSDNNNSEKDKRRVERYKSCIPVLIQKKGHKGTTECNMMNISELGFAVRIDKMKTPFNIDEEFFLIVDPHLFRFNKETPLKYSAKCIRIEPNTLMIGAAFINLNEEEKKEIKEIVHCFKITNENEY